MKKQIGVYRAETHAWKGVRWDDGSAGVPADIVGDADDGLQQIGWGDEMYFVPAGEVTVVEKYGDGWARIEAPAKSK